MTGDSKLAGKIRGGDKQVFESLFRSSYVSLVHHAARLTRDYDAAEEIVQDLFFRLWQERNKLKIVSSLQGYLFRSVYNRALHYLEHQKVVSRHHDAIAAASEKSSEPVTEAIYHRELLDRVTQVLERLPERAGNIFRMSRFEGMKYSEIAEKLAVSKKTVEADMGKALKEFRKVLAEK